MGPFTVVCLLLTILALATVPLWFKLLGKKSSTETEHLKLKLEAEEAERKRRSSLAEIERKNDAAREAKTQDALIEVLRGSLLELGKVSGSLEGVTNAIKALAITFLSRIDTSEKTVLEKLDDLLREIREQKDPPRTIRPSIPTRPK